MEICCKLMLRVIVCTWGVYLICWNLYLKGGVRKLTFLKAHSSGCASSVLVFLVTTLNLEKSVRSWLLKLNKQFKKLCTISSAVCHQQSKQLPCSKLAFGDVGIQLKVRNCLSLEASMKVKCFSVSSSVCSIWVAREWRVCQCRAILFLSSFSTLLT